MFIAESAAQSVAIAFPTLHRVLLAKTQEFIESAKDTTSDEFFKGFSYLFFDVWEETGLAELEPIVAELMSEKYKTITETNLAIAHANSNWREFPIQHAIGDYLNDFLNYLIPRIINLEDWRTGFEKHYRIFEQEYLSDTFTVECFGHIGNFAYDYSGTGELNDHTHVIVLSRLGMGIKHEVLCNKTADYFRVQQALSDTRFPGARVNFDGQPQFLHYTTRIEKMTFGKTTFDSYEIMRKFVLAVALLTPYRGKPYCDAIALFHQGRLSPTLGWWGSLAFPEGRIDDEREVAEPKSPANTWLERLWARLEGVDHARLTALDYHLDDSLRRGWRSTRNPYSERLKITDELERLTDYFSAFDSMYKISGWTDKKLPGRLSKLMGLLVTYKRHPHDQRKPAEWKTVADFVCYMYLIRCDYEHGRVRDAIQKAGSAQRFEGMVRQMKAYLCQVAILFVMNDDFEAQLPRIECGDFSGLKTIYY